MRRIHACFAFVLAIASLPAQEQELRKNLTWRSLGPARGGRVATVTGVPSQPDVFWMGACGGGVWKTTDAGGSWNNVSDGSFGGSIGAVAVAESDPNVVYVGGGEVTVRGNVSHGSGLWKSDDAGKSWKRIGFADAHHIPRIRVHPKNPDLLWVAVLGHLYESHDTRGIYRSKDGGKTFERVHFVDKDVGACDLCLDPLNPRVLYATTWRVRRTPWSLESGGEGSGLWKSGDGGDTWTSLNASEGFPSGTLGIVGVAASAAKDGRVWAIVENADGGVFRSDDAGKTWLRVSADRSLRQRAWYYSRIYADPKDAETCWVVNVSLHKSSDGGKTFTTVGTRHGDHHDLWLAPDDPQRMIVADDGGASVSRDGGRSWSAQDNQATAQFYRVTTDSTFPYRVYGAQQDNSTLRIRSRGPGARDGKPFEVTAGGESGHLAPDPRDPEVVYGGSYGGFLQRLDHTTGLSRVVDVWPDLPIGAGADVQRYRFQWNFPLFFSPHDPKALYAAGNRLFVTRDEGHSWTALSPDLTRDDKQKQAPSGGPITKDNTGVEYYCTIFAACESQREKGLLWCGSDDGLVHVSRDGGGSWKNVTPKELPEWARVNALEPHPFVPGGLYLAATCYQLGDFRPLLFRTEDYGATWTRITEGIQPDHFTRVVRADPARKGVLYAGTEQGVYVSFDDGAAWQSLQLNLPVVPVTDLACKDGDLVAATQGRAFWVLDDVAFLHEAHDLTAKPSVHLFRPRPVVRATLGVPSEATFRVYFAEAPKEPVELEIRDAAGKPVRKLVAKKKPAEAKAEPEPEDDTTLESPVLDKLGQGLQTITWNLRHPGALKVQKMVLWGGELGGPRAAPGRYSAVLRVGSETREVPFTIVRDPRLAASEADLVAQTEFLLACRDEITAAHRAILRIRDLGTQVQDTVTRTKALPETEERKSLVRSATTLRAGLDAIEEALYQTKAQSSQDVLNFPVRLNNKLAALAGSVAGSECRPSAAAEQVRTELVTAIDAQLGKLRDLIASDVAAFNEAVKRADVPRVVPK